MNSIIEELKQFVIANKTSESLPYINLTDDDKYAGWVNATGSNGSNLLLKLDLTKEWDQFCLFALASAWSRTGQWENAVYFVINIRKCFNDIKNIDIVKLRKECNSFVKEHGKRLKEEGKTRKKLAFRKDLYPSFDKLTKKWSKIKQKLEGSGKSGNWKGFVKYLRGIKGLAGKDKAMSIKIPLILRELRCQKIFNIPGGLCCTADSRVKKTYKERGVGLPSDFIKASEKIYEDFGDLYDIPAFANAGKEG